MIPAARAHEHQPIQQPLDHRITSLTGPLRHDNDAAAQQIVTTSKKPNMGQFHRWHPRKYESEIQGPIALPSVNATWREPGIFLLQR